MPDFDVQLLDGDDVIGEMPVDDYFECNSWIDEAKEAHIRATLERGESYQEPREGGLTVVPLDPALRS